MEKEHRGVYRYECGLWTNRRPADPLEELRCCGKRCCLGSIALQATYFGVFKDGHWSLTGLISVSEQDVPPAAMQSRLEQVRKPMGPNGGFSLKLCRKYGRQALSANAHFLLVHGQKWGIPPDFLGKKG